MTSCRAKQSLRGLSAIALLACLAVTGALAANPQLLLKQLDDYPHAQSINFTEGDVIDYEVGLGAMQKIGGAWKFKHSERFSGVLTRYTWQIVDGFTSIEVMDELVTHVEGVGASKLLFTCDGRDCGQGVQWANRVFHLPVLYGREELQRYRVYSLGEDSRYLMLMYSSARTADRQYLHVELLEVAALN